MGHASSFIVSLVRCPLHVVLFQVARWPAGSFSWDVYALVAHLRYLKVVLSNVPTLVIRRWWCGATSSAKVSSGLTPRVGCCVCVWALDQRQCGTEIPESAFEGLKLSPSRVVSCCRAQARSIFNCNRPLVASRPRDNKRRGVEHKRRERGQRLNGQQSGVRLQLWRDRSKHLAGHKYEAA